MTRLQRKLATLDGTMRNLAEVIQQQQNQITNLSNEVIGTRHAMETVVQWVASEAGEGAIERLNVMIAQSTKGETDGIIIKP